MHRGQNKSTLGPEKTESHFSEISPLSELVRIYNKLNTNAKKSPCHRYTKKRRNTKLKLCMSEELSTYNKKKEKGEKGVFPCNPNQNTWCHFV